MLFVWYFLLNVLNIIIKLLILGLHIISFFNTCYWPYLFKYRFCSYWFRRCGKYFIIISFIIIPNILKAFFVKRCRFLSFRIIIWDLVCIIVWNLYQWWFIFNYNILDWSYVLIILDHRLIYTFNMHTQVSRLNIFKAASTSFSKMITLIR